jgi:hypothetical protein
MGGSLKYTLTDGARLGFWINGSGFILYTSVGPHEGLWEVYVDGVQWPFAIDGWDYDYIDLYDWRLRPMGYGVINLGPGLHYIELRARIYYEEVAFDGVRVFP